MAGPIPSTIEDLSEPWLSEILGAPVRAFRSRVIGDARGFLSTTAAVDLEYAGGATDAPAGVVVKIEPAEGELRTLEREVHAFEREIRFYERLAERITTRVPRVFHAELGAEASVLVMEDLSGLASGDQVAGLSHDRVMAAVRQVARLHAAFWSSEELASLDWIPEHDHFWDEGYEHGWPSFAETYGLRIGREAVALGEAVVRHEAWLRERLASRPRTVIHADLRADNILFGEAGTENAAVLLDWQLTSRSLAAIDPTRLLGGSEPAAERAGHQLEILAAWHEELLLCGLRDYSFEEALDDFRLGALYNLRIPIKSFNVLDPESAPRVGRFMDAQALRMFASALELDAGSILPRA